jgi:hypothetical protein
MVHNVVSWNALDGLKDYYFHYHLLYNSFLNFPFTFFFIFFCYVDTTSLVLTFIFKNLGT